MLPIVITKSCTCLGGEIEKPASDLAGGTVKPMGEQLLLVVANGHNVAL
jgi:hypothetical protein